MASRLTGWQLNIMTVEEAEERHAAEDAAIRNLFIEHLNVDEETADVLLQEPAEVYHAKAGAYLSSHLLADFLQKTFQPR